MNMKTTLAEKKEDNFDGKHNKSNAIVELFSSAANQTENYQEYFDKLPLGVFVLQEDFFLYANSSLIRTLGYEDKSELLGASFFDLIHPEDREYIKLCNQKEHGQMHPGKLLRICTKDGHLARVNVGCKVLNSYAKDRCVGYLVDLTPFHERNISLQESLNKYKMIVDDVEDVLAEVDLQGNIRSVNNNANLKIWGVSQEKAIGTNYRCYVDRKNEKIVRQAYLQIYQTGIPGKVTYEIKRTDGQKRFVEDSASLIFDAEGKPAGFRVVSRDVTDRKETEKKLAEHRTCLEAIFSSVKDAIITVDTELRVIEANKSTESICGIVVQDIIHQNLTTSLSQCNQSCCDVVRMTLEKKTTIKDYRIHCGFQGRKQEVNITSSPLLDKEGTFMGAVMVIRDITLLRNMERELRERNQFHNIIGQSQKMRAIYSLVESLADLDTTVLITGESGTGKELVARALHYSGRRAFKPFVAVNCSALTESLLESELFGHVKGAFTGATREREGRFQAANGGTILLDEIGDLSPLIQLKLLRVLQEKIFERVGDSKQHKADVRIITCTNRDLKEKVRRGELREDLYYRLKVVEIVLPPLRERLEDIPLLVDHFQKTFNDKLSKHVEKVRQDVLSSFMEYKWPGNVRELEHVMEHAFVLCQGNQITMDDLPLEFKESLRPTRICSQAASDIIVNDSDTVNNALIQARGNKAKAARILGVSRQTIYRKIYQYQLQSRL